MGTATAQGGGGGMDMSSMSSLITSGVDDLMQSTEFWTNTYINNLSRGAKAKKAADLARSGAEARLIDLQGKQLKSQMGRQKKIRNLLLGY